MEEFKTMEDEVIVEERVQEEGLGSKIKAGLKKHGKKIAAGAAVLTCGIIGYVIGVKANDRYYDSDDDLIDLLPADNSEEVETE